MKVTFIKMTDKCEALKIEKIKWSDFEEKLLMDIINSGDNGAIKCVMVDLNSKFVEFLADPQ